MHSLSAMFAGSQRLADFPRLIRRPRPIEPTSWCARSAVERPVDGNRKAVPGPLASLIQVKVRERSDSISIRPCATVLAAHPDRGVLTLLRSWVRLRSRGRREPYPVYP